MGRQMSIQEQVRKHKGYLTTNEEQERRQRISNNEGWLKTHKSSEYRRVRNMDESYVIKQLSTDKKTLNERAAPRDLKDTERTKLYTRVKYLEGKIRDGMPTRDEMMGKRHSNPGNPNSKYQEARPGDVKKHMKWLSATQKYQDEWKKIMRILEPDDPEAANVERLRK